MVVIPFAVLAVIPIGVLHHSEVSLDGYVLPVQTLLLNFHAIIRFQPFQFYPQTLCWKELAAETGKY
jgi:hypothetical protein